MQHSVQRFLTHACQSWADRAVDPPALVGSHFRSHSLAMTYFSMLYPDSEGTQNRRAENIRSELFRLFEHGRGQDIPETKLTTWAAFNAVAEFVDHHRSTRGRTEQERASRRLESAWFGSGNRLKSEAWKLALEMAT